MKGTTQIIIICFFLNSCANIVMPTGGEKDTAPPKLSHTSPENNTKNFNSKNAVFVFDENIQTNSWAENFNISPATKNPIKYKVQNKTLTIDLENQLEENTTYCLNLNNCIRDINEGNILEKLNLSFSSGEILDSLKLTGKVLDAMSLEPISNAKVFLQETDVIDSLCFEKKPKYTTKTNKNGVFTMSNLNNNNYSIFCITGIDFAYHDGDLIGFYETKVNALDSIEIILLLYDPLFSKDGKNDTNSLKSTDNNIKLVVNCKFEENVIIQLYQEKKIIKEAYFEKEPYLIEGIESGEYEVRIIIDENKNNTWDSGNYKLKKLPEKVFVYHEPINLRENWTLDLDCFID